jgi:hypothetical protein
VQNTNTGTGKVVVNRSMSLDGFIAGPGDAMDWIFDFVAPDASFLTETAAATGAMLIGRRTDEVGNRMEATRAAGQPRAGMTPPPCAPATTSKPPGGPGTWSLTCWLGLPLDTNCCRRRMLSPVAVLALPQVRVSARWMSCSGAASIGM